MMCRFSIRIGLACDVHASGFVELWCGFPESELIERHSESDPSPTTDCQSSHLRVLEMILQPFLSTFNDLRRRSLSSNFIEVTALARPVEAIDP